MELMIQIIIGLIAAFAVYNLIHYLFVTRPSRKRLLLAQRVSNEAVDASIKQLIDINKIATLGNDDLKSELIADVWGRGVMAFEYHIPVSKVQTSIPNLKQLLSQTLADYGNTHHMHARIKENDSPVFVVTDMWQLDDRLHFDVAYLINLTTIEYVDDLSRLK